MKLAMSIVLLSASLSTAGSVPERVPLGSQPGFEEPARSWSDIEEPATRQRCRDRIEQVRSASGKPELHKAPAGGDEPLLHYAVDRRIDGCGVLVPVNDPADLREPPLPGTPRLRPAEPGN